MPNTRARKIVRVGDSLAVTLPPDWLRGNGLGAGDRVALTYDSDVRVRIPRASGTGVASPGTAAKKPAKLAGQDDGVLALAGT